jgi:pSer/pThr/pTyr-binding forkhead associated (FHA) protein
MVHREPTAARREPPPVHREPKKPETISPEARRPQVAPPEIEEREEVPLQPVKAPLVIQYGPTLRSFKELPVTIGKGPKCHFIIDHPAIFDQHAQIFFSKEQYWVKDLTGQGLVLINRKPAGFQAFLKPNDLLAMSPRGPVFRYLGEGRLAETEEPDLQPPSPSAESAQKGPREETPGGKETQKPSSVFKKFFRS